MLLDKMASIKIRRGFIDELYVSLDCLSVFQELLLVELSHLVKCGITVRHVLPQASSLRVCGIRFDTEREISLYNMYFLNTYLTIIWCLSVINFVFFFVIQKITNLSILNDRRTSPTAEPPCSRTLDHRHR